MDDEPLAVTSNTVSMGKKLLKKGQASDSELEKPHHLTHLRTEVTAPYNNKRLAGGSDDNDSEP